ncbi:MAG: S8 family serine peptidase [Thermoguttaceae bacterium]
MTMGQRGTFRLWQSVGRKWLSAPWGSKRRPRQKSSSGLSLFHARIESLEHRNLLSVATTNDLTILAPAGIEGRIWNDLDADGLMEAGEPKLAGVTVYLDLNRNGSLDANESSTTTAADDPLTSSEDETGKYYFAGLEPGSYAVTVLLALGWQATVFSGSSQGAENGSGGGFFGGGGTGTGTFGGSIISNGGALATDSSSATATSADMSESATVGASAVPPPDAASNLIHLTGFRNDPRFAGVDGGKAAVVILDSGIDPDHPFFGPDADGNGVADRIVYQYDFVDGDQDASDPEGHGTHLAGIIGSQNATYAGMAPGVDIIALRVLGADGKGEFAKVEAALQWVLQHASDYNIVAVNMSFGDHGNYTSPLSLYGIGDELATLAAQNVIVVTAAGNDFYQRNSALGVAYPAADPNVVSVGAVYAASYGNNDYGGSGPVVYSTGPDRITPYSQRDPSLLTVFAPGAVIVNAGLNGGAVASEGTSQAAAHVTGIAALAQQLATEQLGRRLTAAEFRELLRSTGTAIRDGDDEHDNVTNTGLTFSRVNVMALAEKILQLDQVPGRELVRLGQDQVASYVDFGIHVPPDLGTVDFCTVSGQDVTGGEAWYRFRAARDGILSAELTGVESGATPQITLYLESGSQVALGSQPTRLDAMDVKAGQAYAVHVTGFGPNATLRLANLVQRSGSEVRVFGTDAADTFAFDATSGRRVSVNGLTYQFTSEITSVVIDGDSGEDTAELTGSPGDDSAVFAATGGKLTGPDYRLMLANVAHTTLNAGDGTDVAYLTGTQGNDTFVADRNQGTLAGDGFSLKAVGFERLHSLGSGGSDTAVLRDSDGAERLVAKPGDVQLYGDGYRIQAKSFAEVTTYGTPGTGDVAQLYDSRGNDTLTASPEMATLAGTGFSLTAADFDTVTATARFGGHDEAVFMGSSGSDELMACPQYSELRGLGYALKAAHFDEFRAYGLGGNDVARMYDSMGDDLFVTDGLESQLAGSGFNNVVVGFKRVCVYAGEGGHDTAQFPVALSTLTPRDGLLTGPGYACRADGFAEMLGPSSDDVQESSPEVISVSGIALPADLYLARNPYLEFVPPAVTLSSSLLDAAVESQTNEANSTCWFHLIDAVYSRASADGLQTVGAGSPADRLQPSGSPTSLPSNNSYLRFFYQSLGFDMTRTKSSWAKDRKDPWSRDDLLSIDDWEPAGAGDA